MFPGFGIQKMLNRKILVVIEYAEIMCFNILFYNVIFSNDLKQLLKMFLVIT